MRTNGSEWVFHFYSILDHCNVFFLLQLYRSSNASHLFRLPIKSVRPSLSAGITHKIRYRLYGRSYTCVCMCILIYKFVSTFFFIGVLSIKNKNQYKDFPRLIERYNNDWCINGTYYYYYYYNTCHSRKASRWSEHALFLMSYRKPRKHLRHHNVITV